MTLSVTKLTMIASLSLGMAFITLSSLTTSAQAQPQQPGRPQPIDWHEAEKDILTNYVQLTNPEMFFKAGEAYFSPNQRWIIFQAVPAVAEDEKPDEFYTMYIAELLYDDNNKITGLGTPKAISPEGSANTCGFFHPIKTGQVIFGSTITAPEATTPPGFQRESSKYSWMFPRETEVVVRQVSSIAIKEQMGGNAGENRSAQQLRKLTTHDGYDAECAFDPKGRYIVYASMIDDKQMCDLMIWDSAYDKTVPVVAKPGYDGGPFFSPQGDRICYRSDRNGNNLLQIYVSDLEFDEKGTPTGNVTEYQLTAGENVNWAPFWHPNGRYLIYTSSAVSHYNYEIFIMDADPGNLDGSDGTIRYGMNKRRITHANGFDGLSVFSPDGKRMMWTSQRTDDPTIKGSSQIWVADLIMPIDPPVISAEESGH